MDLNAIQAAVEQACVEFLVRGSKCRQAVLKEISRQCSGCSLGPNTFKKQQQWLFVVVYKLHMQNPATQAHAAEVLLQFRQQHRPALPACRHILEHSHNADARFQAALVLKDALVREWGTLDEEQKNEVQAWLFHQVVALSGNTTQADSKAVQVLRASLSSALAVSIKRGWLERPQDRRSALLQEVVSLVSGCSTGATSVATACALFGLLEAVVSEFSQASASPLGLSLEYHKCCSDDFEAHQLQQLFSVATNLARQAVISGAAARGDDGGVTAAAASLMTACLQWEFKKPRMPGHTALAVPAAKQRGGDAAPAVAPGESWAGLLLDPTNTGWLVVLLQQLKAMYGAVTSHSATGSQASQALAALPASQRAAVVATATKGRSLLLALCSLSGDVFPREYGQGGLRHRYLTNVLQAVLPLSWPLEAAVTAAHAVGWEASELLDACRCISALAPIHRAKALQAAGSAVLQGVAPEPMKPYQPQDAVPLDTLMAPPPLPGADAGGFLGFMQLLTLQLVRIAGVNAAGLSTSDEGDDKYWQQEALDMCLEAWSSLMVGGGLAAARPDGSHLPLGAVPAAAAVFIGVTDAALVDAARGATAEVEDAHEAAEAVSLDDWMARLAGLGRQAPGPTFHHLVARLGAAQQALATCAATGADPSVPLEQLCWCVRMSAHCLADSGAGETPLVPLLLQQAIEAGVPGVVEAMQQLASALLALPALVLQEQARHVMSPRLMEACTWSLARWCDTYLYPEEPLPAPLQLAYGDASHEHGAYNSVANGSSPAQGGGAALLDMVVQVANVCLTAFPGETELHKQVVTVLLRVLVRHKKLCAKLIKNSAWQALKEAVAGRAEVLQRGLGQKLHRGLAQNLCMAASGIHHTAGAAEYVQHLLGKTVSEVISLAARPDLAAMASRADVAVGVGCLLETIRGATRAAPYVTLIQPTIYAMTSGLLQPLLQLQAAFKAHTQTVALVLKLGADIVKSHISFLKGYMSTLGCPACSQLGELEVLLRWVLALLQQYAHINTWGQRLAATTTLQEEASLAEASRDICALLRLLEGVTQRDLTETCGGNTGSASHQISAATAANAHHVQDDLTSAKVVLVGLSILLPLITPPLLKFPELPRLYFHLLAYVMESYPEQLASMGSSEFGSLMRTLEFGLSDNCSDTVVLQAALEGLAGLARYQFDCWKAGQPGFSHHTTGDGGSVTSHFLALLLRRLLIGSWGQDMVELAADSLQMLLALETAAYISIAQQIIQSQVHEAGIQQRVGNALSSLIHPEQLLGSFGGARHGNSSSGSSVPSLGHIHKRVFRQAVCHVTADVRSLICTR